MALFDNRDSGSGGGGAPIDTDTAVNAAKSDWKRETFSVGALDITNGYMQSANIFNDAKVMVSLHGLGALDIGVDVTIDTINNRILFEPDFLTVITGLFNTYGTLKFEAAYFQQT